MTKRLNIEKGTRFGMLTVIKEVEPYRSKWGDFRQFLCQCDCGKTTITTLNRLRIGMTKSCGCQIGTRPKYKELTNTRIYNIWRSMKQRCYDSKAISFPNYGGRGISVCDEWRNDFMAFYNWAIAHGYNESLTIDRIDCNGNYEPSNCKWATMKEQMQNKRNNVVLELNGESHTISEWSRITGIKSGALQGRKYAGWSDEKILTTPVKNFDFHKMSNGKSPIILVNKDGIVAEYDSIRDAAKSNNLSYASVYRYLRGEQKTCRGYDFRYKDNELNLL